MIWPLVKWQGYSNEENTWEPKENIDAADLIEEFEKNQGRDDVQGGVQNRIQNQRVHDQSDQDQNVHDQNVHDKNVHDQSVHDQSDKSVHDQNDHDQHVQDQHVHDQSVHDQSVQRENVKNLNGGRCVFSRNERQIIQKTFKHVTKRNLPKIEFNNAMENDEIFSKLVLAHRKKEIFDKNAKKMRLKTDADIFKQVKNSHDAIVRRGNHYKNQVKTSTFLNRIHICTYVNGKNCEISH